MHTTRILYLLFVFPLLLAGCDGGHGPAGGNIVKKATTPANGKFTINGLPPGQVGTPGDFDNPPHIVVMKLYPKGRAPQPDDVYPSSQVDSQTGKFSFDTYQAGDGIPAGEYIMTFESLRINPIGRYKMGPDRFKNNFNNPLSQDPEKYTVKVPEGNKEPIKVPDIDIKMEELVDKEPVAPFATPSELRNVRDR